MGATSSSSSSFSSLAAPRRCGAKLAAKLFGSKGEDQKIIMLGLDAAGKTTVLYMLKLGEVVTTIPTVGFNVETIEYSGKKMVSFTFWDVGGRDKVRPLFRHYYQGVNALVAVVDSADRDRFEVTRDELKRTLNEDELRDVPLLVFANKQDIPGAATVQEVADKLDLNSIRNRMWHIQASCALTGEGLHEGLSWLQEPVYHPHEAVTGAASQSGSGTAAAGKVSDQAAKLPAAGPGSTVDTASTADSEPGQALGSEEEEEEEEQQGEAEMAPTMHLLSKERPVFRLQ
mmetsp:Transcript_28084/g.61011  ORF Transcript_28084/g.61011 Transcript_28084/m.61011 type:complete len:287 (+) Transcript_28084:92-952(+)